MRQELPQAAIQALNCPRLAFNCAANPSSTLPLAVVSTTACAAFSAWAWILDPPTHRLRALRLMLGRRVARPIAACTCSTDACTDCCKRTVAQHQQPFAGLPPGLTDRLDRLTRALLQRDDVRLDIAGGALRLARQRAHFVRHHRKAAPGLTGPRPRSPR
jgi:hypothetical protein